ncbi:agamous-like MADS-box protein AGL80 [Populus alba x Populus x berolinensis]|nr:agamous-like MADS-box protein AGL80 [Populus alba x Populus x berolinensis]
MGRRKVKHELISNESVRKVTFRKRKAGLLKKLDELATLCGVAACAIIFSAYDDQPEIWPSPAEAVFAFEELKRSPSRNPGKYMVDQEAFLTTNASKLNQQLEKQRRRNLGFELELMMAGCTEGMDLHDLKHIKNPSESIQFLEEMIASVTSEIELAENENND